MDITENKKSTLSGDKKFLVPNMGKKIIVTEKPSVAQSYASVLGVSGRHDGYIENNEWIITWCVGHLISLAYPETYDPDFKEWKEDDLPFLPSKYRYAVISTAKKQFDVIKSLYNRKDIDRIYYAGDPAREGIYIQALVREFAGHNPSADEKVIWIDSQTEEEILNGIKTAKPYTSYHNLIDSGYERAIEDYATGINLSRMLSLRYGQIANKYAATSKYRPVAVGRVMTCVLGMVTAREREIINFKPTAFYKINNTIDGISAEWKAVSSSRLAGSPKLYSESGFKSLEDAKAFLSSLPAAVKIEKIEKKKEKKNAPLLFNLAELQSECSAKFKISPDKTLEIAQSLYEKKLTTYPRTDARVLSTAIAKEIKKNISGIAAKYSQCAGFAKHILNNHLYDNIAKTKYTDDSKVADHYAVIPTGTGYDSLSGLSDMESKVYELIVRRFLSIFYPPAEYIAINVTEDASGEKFFANAKVLAAPGYFEVAGMPKNADADISVFEKLKEGTTHSADYSIKKGETTAPKRFTSGSIILAMENAGNLIEDEELRAQIKGSGIGTSSTRAEVLKKLISLEYLKLNSKTQVLTPDLMGNIVYEIVLDTVPELLNPKMTASWEKGLQSIADGEIEASAYRKTVENYIRKEVTAIKNKTDNTTLYKRLEPFKNSDAFVSENLPVPCPICGGKLKTTRFGCICEHYKKEATDDELKEKSACKFGIGKISSKIIPVKNIVQLIADGKCNTIKGFTSKEGKKFDAALKLEFETKNGYRTANIKYVFDEPAESSIKCPKCSKNLIKNRFSFDCDCGYKIYHVVAGKAISDADIKKLINGSTTSVIKGLTKKDGKKFEAKLKADENGKISFVWS